MAENGNSPNFEDMKNTFLDIYGKEHIVRSRQECKEWKTMIRLVDDQEVGLKSSLINKNRFIAVEGLCRQTTYTTFNLQ